MKTLKTLAIIVIAGFTANFSNAQNAREATVKVGKAEQPAIIADYNYSKTFVNDVLKAELTKAGFGKSKTKNGFSVYSAVNWAAVAPNIKLDVWSKTEERKGVTTLSVLISKGYDNYINAAMDSGTIENLKSYLNNLNASLVAADLTQKIADQTKVVKQAEEKLNGLKKDADKLQSDKQKIENSIKQNLDEQQKANALINTENTKLESLKQQQKG